MISASPLKNCQRMGKGNPRRNEKEITNTRKNQENYKALY
jgi:hypothetical protein